MRQEFIHPDVFSEIQAAIVPIEQDHSLEEATNFMGRASAQCHLEEHVFSRIEHLLARADKGDKKKLRALKRQALRLQALLDQANAQLFASFRTQITTGAYSTAQLRQTLRGYSERVDREEWDDPPRYDDLDTFVDGLLQIETLPRAQRQPDPQMVGYQPTPARIVLDMVERLGLASDDVFYDLGSGLGRVVILVGLLSGSRAKGIEFEPAYCGYAQRHAAALGLSHVAFVNADAREVKYADGTVFFLYTPFKGTILQRVMELLHYEARTRRIRVCTYGPGALDILDQDWLASVDPREPDIHQVTIFESR